MRRTVGLLVLGIVLAASTALADRGSIPYKPGVRIFEPNQRAMIAWNGRQEILLIHRKLPQMIVQSYGSGGAQGADRRRAGQITHNLQVSTRGSSIT